VVGIDAKYYQIRRHRFAHCPVLSPSSYGDGWPIKSRWDIIRDRVSATSVLRTPMSDSGRVTLTRPGERSGERARHLKI
jgi:hypothetical protein